MFRFAGFAVLMLSTSAFAGSGILDLSTPQTDDFRSIVDLRGNPDLRPQEGNPVRQVEKPAAPAVQPVALTNFDAQADEPSMLFSGHDTARTDRPRVGVGVYVGLGQRNAVAGAHAPKDGVAARSHKRSAPSIRLGRRR